MGAFFTWQDPHLRSLLLVQVIGFPLVFLIRAARAGLRARTASPAERSALRIEAASYACFALTSMVFAVNIPAAIIIFAAGIAFAAQAFQKRRYPAQAVPPTPAPPVVARGRTVRRRAVLRPAPRH